MTVPDNRLSTGTNSLEVKQVRKFVKLKDNLRGFIKYS